MEGGGPAGQGHGVVDADPLGELALEGVDVGPDGCDPVGVEGVEQHAALLASPTSGGER